MKLVETRPFGSSVFHYDRICECVVARRSGQPDPHGVLDVMTSIGIVAGVVGIHPHEVWDFVQESVDASC